MSNEWGRDSAGAPPKTGGEITFYFPDGHKKRLATFTCRHCGIPQHVPEGKTLNEVAAICYICFGLVGSNCGCQSKGDCKTTGEFMARVERAEARERFLKAAGVRDY
jgi:hypothetical protein